VDFRQVDAETLGDPTGDRTHPRLLAPNVVRRRCGDRGRSRIGELRELCRRRAIGRFERHRGRDELAGEALDLLLADVCIGDDADQLAYRARLALLRDDPPQHAARRRLDRVDDLLGLDVEDLLTLLDARARRHAPVRDGALGHLDAPLRHRQGRDRRRHQLTFRTWRIAASMRGGPGT
jgi:hypothetical protein